MDSVLNIWDEAQQKFIGIPALKGDKGDTPVKGVDYFTVEDKASIVQDVLAALPDGDEVSY